MRGSGSRRLMANPPWRDKCVTRLQQCAAMLRMTGAPHLLNARLNGTCRILAVSATQNFHRKVGIARCRKLWLR